MREAKDYALQRAKIKALADEFGTTVSMTNSSFAKETSSESIDKFVQVAEYEVNGEWIETVGKPDITVIPQDDGFLITAKVKGKAREIKRAKVEFMGIMRDFNMLVTVNTQSKQIVLTSVLRGYYIDVPAYNIKDTLMCLGSLDSDVSKEALEELFDIDIDYTLNINTNSLVNVVDTLGGVEFCSDYDFTTTHVLTTNTYDDKTGTKLNVSKGCKNYNGKEILAISRERLNLRNNERGRINNCRKILLSVAKKTLSGSTLSNYTEILNSYSNLYTTDMNKKAVTNLLKSLIENYSDYEIIEQYPDGTDGKGMGHLGTQEVGVTIPDMEQVNTVSKKIKEVLNNK